MDGEYSGLKKEYLNLNLDKDTKTILSHNPNYWVKPFP